MSGKKTRIVASPEALTHNPFGALLPADASPSMESSDDPAPTPENEAAPSIAPFSFEGKAANAKVVIARERKGRAGKTVTLARTNVTDSGISGRIEVRAAHMANVLGIDTLMLLTAVPKVAINWGKPDQRELDVVTLRQLKAYQAYRNPELEDNL